MAAKGFRLPPREAWPGPLTDATDRGEYIYDFGDALAAQFPWDDPAKRRALVAAADPRQVEFLGVWVLDGEVCNGGFCQVFTNSFGELAEEGLAGFRRYGMSGFVDLIDEVFDAFPRPIPRDRGARHAMLEERFGTPSPGKNIGQLSSNFFDPYHKRYFALRRGRGERGDDVGFEVPVSAFLDANPGLFFDLG